MKIAVVYNSPSAEVLQHRGPPTQEPYTDRHLNRIVEALGFNDHEVIAVEGDRRLADRLAAFFGPLTDDQWPGLAFNLAFGIQGHLRYCHVPAMLEMLGVPYLGSGPLGHALATNKAVAKSIFRDHGLPTPDFAVADSPDFADPGLGFPVVVKPVEGASSLGVRLVHDEEELRAAVAENLAQFREPVLVERYMAGREINVSVIGNRPGLALPPVEVVLGKGGPPIYALEDKHGLAPRSLQLLCPAPIPEALAGRARQLALQAFAALACRDWARIEMRIDDQGRLQLLEVNTIPGLGPISSLPASAERAGIEDFPTLVQRLVDVAVARYQEQPS